MRRLLAAAAAVVVLTGGAAGVGICAGLLGLLPDALNRTLDRLFQHVPAETIGWTLISAGFVLVAFATFRIIRPTPGRHR